MGTVIVGGGVSGLTLAHALRARGEEVTLLEAADLPGGKMRSWREKGYLLESGPNGFLDRDADARELARELGIEARIRPAGPAAQKRFVFTRGKLRQLPLSPPAFLSSDVLPLASRLRVLLEPLSRRGPEADESLASFGRRHLGERATRVLLDAMQMGTWAGDVDRLSVRAAFPKLHALEKAHRSLVVGAIKSGGTKKQASLPPGALSPSGQLATFDGGMQTLLDALLAEVGDRVRTGARVQRVEKQGGWTVTLQSGERVSSERLVLATPVEVTRRLLDFDPALEPRLAAFRGAPITVVHLGFAKHVLAPGRIEGFGALIPAEEQREVLGIIFVSSSFPFRAPEGHTLLTCMVGGSVRPELAARSDDALLSSLRAELETILGVPHDAHAELVAMVRWAPAIPQYDVGHLERVAAVREALAPHPGLFLLGNAYEGVGVNDCIRSARALAKALTSGDVA